jgi:hypothetical protein
MKTQYAVGAVRLAMASRPKHAPILGGLSRSNRVCPLLYASALSGYAKAHRHRLATRGSTPPLPEAVKYPPRSASRRLDHTIAEHELGWP